MKRTVLAMAVAVLALAGWSPAPADDVSGADTLLCSVNFALQCTENGECESGPPWNMNLPEFIEVRLGEKMLSTTRSSDEKRTTPIKLLERADGALYLHGDQNGRAFSIVITEETGMATYAVAAEEMVVSGFGACIPRS
jgi:hypothetical protein